MHTQVTPVGQPGRLGPQKGAKRPPGAKRQGHREAMPEGGGDQSA